MNTLTPIEKRAMRDAVTAAEPVAYSYRPSLNEDEYRDDDRDTDGLGVAFAVTLATMPLILLGEGVSRVVGWARRSTWRQWADAAAIALFVLVGLAVLTYWVALMVAVREMGKTPPPLSPAGWAAWVDRQGSK